MHSFGQQRKVYSHVMRSLSRDCNSLTHACATNDFVLPMNGTHCHKNDLRGIDQGGTGCIQVRRTQLSNLVGAAATAVAQGVKDFLIKTLGCWKSSAYLLYVRIPRERLAELSTASAHCCQIKIDTSVLIWMFVLFGRWELETWQVVARLLVQI